MGGDAWISYALYYLALYGHKRGGEGTGGREGGIDTSRCGGRGRDIQARIISLIHTQLQGKRERAAWPWCAHSKREDNHSKMSTHDILKHARLMFTYILSARMSDYLYTDRHVET